jgi:hypothetical protein
MPWRNFGIEISLYLAAIAMIWVLGLAVQSGLKLFDLTEQCNSRRIFKDQIKIEGRYKIASKFTCMVMHCA